MFDNFKGNCIVFFLFFSLNSSTKIGLKAICDILNFFFSKHDLSKISAFEQVFEASKVLFFYIVLIFGSHYKREREKIKSNFYFRYVY